MLHVMYEQGLIQGDEDYIDRLLLGRLSVLQVIVDCLENGSITPQMTGLDPCTGSIIVSNINTGEILAAVGYPTFDNNQFVNTFNSEYFYKLNNDLTTPFVNRPFLEPRAPGSTFKMISAITALETDIINDKTIIYDYVSFTKAGVPYTNCWSSVSHGPINVVKALEVSCNYFFCDAIYNIGNVKEGTEKESIAALNKYMIAFGFNDPTGVEISERNQGNPPDRLTISSPEYKEAVEKRQNPDAPPSRLKWYDGDTVKTAIGQANNNYTAANMAKYISTIATKGLRYRFHLVDKIETQKGALLEKVEPKVESKLDISPETWDSVYDGMIRVTEGSNGTAAYIFRDFPIRVAGKTGTAQENDKRNDHSSFGGFAPYEEPQIAVYVLIPFGDTVSLPAVASQIARDVIAEYMGLNMEPETPVKYNSLVR